jgi:hypothetical protein
LPRWHWQAQASLAMRLLTAAVAGVVEAAVPLAAVVVAAWEAAVATAVAALAAVV